MTKKISIVGTGNVAHVMGRMLQRAGHAIVEVTGRQASAVELLAVELGAFGNVQPAQPQPTLPADLYVLALSDTALAQLPAMLMGVTGLWVHTSGAVPLQAITKVARHTAVLYPLQSLRKEKKEYASIPMMLEASRTEDLELLQQVAESCGQAWQVVGSEQRLAYHMAAVFANNFTNHLLTEASLVCRSYNLPFQHLLPLIAETTSRLAQFEPASMQTGPAVRNDVETMHRHLHLLHQDATASAIYRLLSHAIATRHGGPSPFPEFGNMPNI